jgi:hypothetical protein
MKENPPERSAPPLPAASIITDSEGDGISETKSQMTGFSDSQAAAYTIANAAAQSAIPLSPRAPPELLPPRASKLLRPSRVRLFVIPVMVFGFTALLVAIGIYRLKTVDQPETHPQTDTRVPTSPEKQPENGSNELRTSSEDPSPEKSVTPAEPLKSFVLDAAQSYLAIGRPSRPSR